MEHWWGDIDSVEEKDWGKTLSSVTVFSTNIAWIEMGSNQASAVRGRVTTA